MFGYLVLLFTILPALELILLIKMGGHIGAGNTLLLIISTGVVGAYLARMQGFYVFRKIQEDLNKGHMPNHQLLDGLMIFVGGIVLLTPGFITDIIGFFLLIPWTRMIINHFLKRKFESMIQSGQMVNASSLHQNQNKYDDIDI